MPIQTFTPNRNNEEDGGENDNSSEYNSSEISDSQITTGYFDPDVQNYNFTLRRGKKSNPDDNDGVTQSHQFKIVRKLKQSVGGRSEYPSHNGSIISHTSEFTPQPLQKRSSDNSPSTFGGPRHKQSSDATQQNRGSLSSSESDEFRRKMEEFDSDF